MPAIIPIMDSNRSYIFRSLRSTMQRERSRINILSAAYSAALIGWESLRGLSLSCRMCHSMHGLTLRTLTWIHARSHLSARSLTLSSMPGPHGFRETGGGYPPRYRKGVGKGEGGHSCSLNPIHWCCRRRYHGNCYQIIDARSFTVTAKNLLSNRASLISLQVYQRHLPLIT